MKMYKVFNPDWTCKGFQYEIGKTYTHEGDISMCNTGFHACKKAVDCFSYYSFDPENKVAEVHLTGGLKHGSNKSVGHKIKIVKEIKTSYVSKDRFSPIEKLVYGMSGVILSGVAVAILALVLR